MSPIFSAPKNLFSLGVLLAFSIPVMGQTYVAPQGGEFSVLGSVRGDQVLPALALSSSNTVVAWEDNFTDRKGAGIGMAMLDRNSLASRKIVVVNKNVASDQIKPAVAELAHGELAFVWESRIAGTPDVYMRLWKKGAFFTGDIRVNGYLNDQQIDPVITPLADGGAIVAWASYGQDGDMWGVFARRVTATGSSPKREFQVNQITSYNQRNPAVATLANGNFVVVWNSENEEFLGSLSVYGRVFQPDCTPVGDEFQINSGTNICANPAVAATTDGGFTVVWAERDYVVRTNSWDVWGRSFNPAGESVSGKAAKINTFTFGDQYRPKIAAGPSGCMVVWTSLGQDGSREGVFGRYWMNSSGPAGPEFIVNTTRPSQQIQPTVAWDGTSRFLVVWSGAAVGGFDLFGQMFSLSPAQ